jgi:hypothetical protein
MLALGGWQSTASNPLLVIIIIIIMLPNQPALGVHSLVLYRLLSSSICPGLMQVKVVQYDTAAATACTAAAATHAVELLRGCGGCS